MEPMGSIEKKVEPKTSRLYDFAVYHKKDGSVQVVMLESSRFSFISWQDKISSIL